MKCYLKKDFIMSWCPNCKDLVDTYKEGTSLSNVNKENSNNISVEIKKQINNVMNINTFKESGIKASVVEIDSSVEEYK